ncbi:unnamed protein product [Lupinus luteus]|uniref:Wall-associated receptor kinase galacturonan-binding domain-containing protein n=1 Tax=Lupinus luteus TaxID=3873 RepID=A0AAV1VZH6_LUPLU
MPTLLFFLVSFLLLLINISAQNTCPNCGNTAVPYPLSTDQNCGDSRYKIYCNNGSLEFLSATKNYYKILSIDPKANKLVIKPAPIVKNTCQSTDLKDGGLLIEDNSPFNISTHNTVMLFNCAETILLSPLNCTATSICKQYEEKVEEGKGCKNTLCCHYLKDSAMNSRKIRIRNGGCSSYTSIVDYKPEQAISSWNYGVELQWVPANK